MPVQQLIPSDPVAALEALGIDVARSLGSEVYASCPAQASRHRGGVDHNPSWSINTETGLHNCFSCGYTGTFVSLVSDVLDVNVYRAIKWIRGQGLDIEVLQNLPQRLMPVEEFEPAVVLSREEIELASFGEPLPGPMERRRITQAACDHYGIRWKEDEAGWVLPIRAPEGAVIGYQFKRKKLVRNRPNDVPKSTTLFGLAELEGRRAILVESPLDVARFYSDGIVGAVSSYGVHVSDEQMRLLLDRVDLLMLALDNDYAGRIETRRIITGQSFHEKEDGKFEIRKSVKWSNQLPTVVFDYGETEAKDPGELDRAGLHYGVNHALSTLEWLNGQLTEAHAKRAMAARLRKAPQRPSGATRLLQTAHGRRGPYRRR